jgi:hypothetical protein
MFVPPRTTSELKLVDVMMTTKHVTFYTIGLLRDSQPEFLVPLCGDEPNVT